MANVGRDAIGVLWDVDIPKGQLVEYEQDEFKVVLLTPAPPSPRDERRSGHVLAWNTVNNFIGGLLGE